MIYFAQLPTGSIKIGKADDVDARVVQLQHEFSGPVTILKTMPGGLKEEAKTHRRFRHLHLRREQFQPGADLMEFIGLPLLVTENPDTVEAADQLKVVRLELTPEYHKLLRMAAAAEESNMALLARKFVMEALDKQKKGGSK